MKLFYIVLAFVALVSAELRTPDVTEIEPLKNVDMNNLVDRFTPKIAQFIVKNGLDPLKLPNEEKKFWSPFPGFPFIRIIKLSLKSGTLEHLSHLRRYGNASLAYEDKLMKLKVGAEFKTLQGAYDYNLRLLIFLRKGRVTVSTEMTRAEVDVSFNVTDYTLALDKLELQIPGRITATIKHSSKWIKWLDRIHSRIINIVLPLFKNTIKNAIQVETAKVIRKLFAEINNKVPFEERARIFENEILTRS